MKMKNNNNNNNNNKQKKKKKSSSTKKTLPSPYFELFAAHRNGMSRSYYKSYPLLNANEGTWEDAFLDLGLTHAELKQNAGGASHVEIGLRVMHVPTKGGTPGIKLIGTCQVLLETLEKQQQQQQQQQQEQYKRQQKSASLAKNDNRVSPSSIDGESLLFHTNTNIEDVDDDNNEEEEEDRDDWDVGGGDGSYGANNDDNNKNSSNNSNNNNITNLRNTRS